MKKKIYIYKTEVGLPYIYTNGSPLPVLKIIKHIYFIEFYYYNLNYF